MPCFTIPAHPITLEDPKLNVLSLCREKLPVHVVVDPILGKVLRPHQREVRHFFPCLLKQAFERFRL